MDYPPDPVMRSLEALITADRLADQDDTIVADMPAGDRWVVTNELLDTLIQKGWVDLDTDEHVTVTAAGVYWYGRWLKLKQPKRVHLYGPLVLKRPALKLKRGVAGNPTTASGGMTRGSGRGNGNHLYGKTEA